jgi:hypothetical protein
MGAVETTAARRKRFATASQQDAQRMAVPAESLTVGAIWRRRRFRQTGLWPWRGGAARDAATGSGAGLFQPCTVIMDVSCAIAL